MSVLHPPGDDEMANESFDIRWKPINSVASIISSLLLMFMEPNFSSPANVPASVQLKNSPEEFKKVVAQLNKKAAKYFEENHSDIFIPHPDTNPNEKKNLNGDEPTEKDKIVEVEEWDSDPYEDDEGEWSDFSEEN